MDLNEIIESYILVSSELAKYMWIVPFAAIFIALIGCIIFNIFYINTTYFKITHKPFWIAFRDFGSLGEYYIYMNLKFLEKNGAKFLFNCYLPRDNGTTTEIDVLLLHNSGIYVFESKNYSGWIFGSEKSKTWTQTLPRGKGRKSQKARFLNPIFQNELHIKCLKNCIQKEVPIYSIVAFSDRCDFKNLNVENANYNVIHRIDAIKVINKNAEKFFGSLSDSAIAEIYDLLYPYTQVSDSAKQKHIDNINNRSKNDNTELVCPKCGAKLVLRETKRGKNIGKVFYGCSDFPKCRYVRNL